MVATTRQIAANRRNRKLWKGHSRDGLRRLREAALLNRPWLKSAGPATEAGKARSKMNALKHGERSAEAVRHRKAMTEALQAVRELVRDADR